VGEVLGGMTQGGTIPRFVLTGGDPDPLQALREEIAERLNSNWRDVRLRLLPTEVEHGSLMGIGLTCVRDPVTEEIVEEILRDEVRHRTNLLNLLSKEGLKRLESHA
jgi:hypothetical protein